MGRRAGGWAKRVMGIKEDTCWDEHWVLHVSDEALNSIPEKKNNQHILRLDFPDLAKTNKNRMPSMGQTYLYKNYLCICNSRLAERPVFYLATLP